VKVLFSLPGKPGSSGFPQLSESGHFCGEGSGTGVLGWWGGLLELIAPLDAGTSG